MHHAPPTGLALTFLTLGALFILGLAADRLGRRTRLPRVTLLLCCGLLVGEAGLGLIPAHADDWYAFLSVSALTLVAFLLGGSLSAPTLKAHGRVILWISVCIVAVTLVVVTGGLMALGQNMGLALLLGAIATATAPAATLDVIRQSGAKGSFPETLKGIVAIDDAWGLIAFSAVVVLVGQMNGTVDSGILSGALREIVGSITLGLVIGLPAAYLTGRLKDGEPLQIEALGIVFLTAGASIWLDLSFLLAGMTAGAVIVNRARHHSRAFHEIEHIQWPFMILFFLLAGASLEPDAIWQVGIIGLAYMALRTIARIVGGWMGAHIGVAPLHQRPWFGFALLPQAGVAVGMALVASKEFPQWSDSIMALTIGTTVAFELFAPFATLYALRRVAKEERK